VPYVPGPNQAPGPGFTGFPVNFTNFQPVDELHVSVVAVDFDEYTGENTSLADEYAQVLRFTKFYETISRGDVTFTIDFPMQWFRMPGPLEKYEQLYVSDYNDVLANDAVLVSDPIVDFSDTDLLIVVLPDKTPLVAGITPRGPQEHAGFLRVEALPGQGFEASAEGQIPNYMGTGYYFDLPRRPSWAGYAHEAGHMFNLPDWYLGGQSAREGSAQQIEVTDIPIGPMGSWSMMSIQDGPSQTLEAWSRWLMGWLHDDEIACFELPQLLDGPEFDVELAPLDLYEGGTKAVIVRTGRSTALVIESRRAIGPDSEIAIWETVGRDPRGLIVYEVDTTYGGQEGALFVQPPAGKSFQYFDWHPRTQQKQVDALFNLGDQLDFEGLSVELRYSGDRDIVRIGPAT